MLRMPLRTENIIRKSLNIFNIRKPGAIRRAIHECVTGVIAITETKS